MNITQQHNQDKIVQVAVPVPLRNAFDYLLPDTLDGCSAVQAGCRVRVRFANRELIGFVLSISDSSDFPVHKLKPIEEVIDSEPVFSEPLWSLLLWMSDYYLAPLGEVIENALPVVLRKGKPLMPKSQTGWRLSEYGRSASEDELHRAPLQLAMVKQLLQKDLMLGAEFSEHSSGWRQALKTLQQKKWVEEVQVDTAPQRGNAGGSECADVTLNQQQTEARDVLSGLSQFKAALLHGVTGSGKTEVYFSVMDTILQQGKQVLLLVPEIGLTPQLIARISARFSRAYAVLHSGLNETERHLAWWHARQGDVGIVIGTRSALFTPFKQLGLIVVDEEHDLSFKQQDGVRYHARDVAVYRAREENVPIILASATPSLESLMNAHSGRYEYCRLTERAASAKMPQVELLDINRVECRDGLSPMLIDVIKEALENQSQVMLFLNRRGYAPVLYCRDCQWKAHCQRCDAHLTIHKLSQRIRCHHCGYEGRAMTQCLNCASENLAEVGEGTQRVETALESLFPAARILRIDRDSTRAKGQLEEVLTQARDAQADILIGTQLITKGHDFPNVNVVGVLNADQGLYSSDFRAPEHLFQQLVQVAGRAGRRHTVGRVYIQTAFPEHPFFKWVQQHDYDEFSQDQLQLRRLANAPPYGYFAILRAESVHQARALQFLRQAKSAMHALEGVRIMDAVPAPMEKRAGRFRAQLLISAQKRSAMHATLKHWLEQENRQTLRDVRWSLDIDPVDMC